MNEKEKEEKIEKRFYPLEYKGYILVKSYPYIGLYKHPAGWYECFQPYDVGMVLGVDTDWSKWR